MDRSHNAHRNDQLRQERLRLNWRQHDLAEQLGTTVVTVKRWERGSQQPSAYFRIKLCALFNKSAEELGLIPDQPANLPSVSGEAGIWNVPFPRNPFFTGRDRILEHLHKVLTNKPTIAACTRSYALSGLGGIGKTQLAIEYAYRHRREYHTVLWVEAETQTSLTSSFVKLATLLALPEKTEEEQSKIVAAVLRWLNQHAGWLLIFDNIEELSLIKPFLPASDQGALLLTTRLQTLGTLAQMVPLTPMTAQEGVNFLLTRTKHLDRESRRKPDTLQEKAVARAIVTEMGGLPLALEQAGAYIDATQCHLTDYLHLFQTAQHRLLNRHESSSDHPLSVSQTFLLAFELVERHNPLAAELLTVCAFLAPEAIPEMFFLEGASSLGPTLETIATDPLAFPDAIKVLLSYSLLQRSASTRTIAVHRLVQMVLQSRLTEAERYTWERRTVHTMGLLFPSEEGTQTNYLSIGEQLATHAQACLLLTNQWNDNETLHIPFMNHVATYLSYRGCYAEAEPVFGQARRMGEQTLGTNHPLVAETIYELASLYRKQGKYTKAEPLFKQVLHIREQSLGSEHSQVAFPLNGLGTLYYEQGKYEQAERCYQRALSIWERALGSEHPSVATPLNNLGALYEEQGKYPQAEACYHQALHIWKQALGAEHPDTAFPLNNLGALYEEQGKYVQAETCYLQALDIRKQALGSEHPSVATPLNNLGELYYKQGKYQVAETYYQQALDIWKRSLGSEHPTVAYALNGLANLSRELGRYEQAKLLYRRALALRQQHLSPQHLDIAETLHDLAHLHCLQQQPKEALLLYQQAQAIREQSHGFHHPKTEETRNAIAHIMQKMNQAREAVLGKL